MKDVEVEVISKEIIKPSSPTPDHLRHYQFSYLDQLCPPVYTSFVLFYGFNGQTQSTITEISNHLKKSLAQVLTLYYPLAGRVDKDNHFVDCNDEGIPYLEAQVKCQLSDVLKNPIPAEINKFLPFELDSHNSTNKFALGVQLNIFECGGFAIGQCISHKVADGISMLMFSKTWAAIARGDEANIERPEFVTATLFPPRDFTGNSIPSVAAMRPMTKKKVTKRFVFDASAIEVLKVKYGGHVVDNNKTQKGPSRVEALSTFIWSRIVVAAATSGKDDTIRPEKTLYAMVHPVNLRPRFDPPLPQCSFGNLFGLARTVPTSINNNTEGGGRSQKYCHGQLARQLREEISKIDNEYMERLKQGDDEDEQYFLGLAIREEVVEFAFSSMCRFPLYDDNDFGWGRPAWVGTPARLFNNLVVFLDTKEGDGIEAYITLAEEVMAKFETDTEFMAFVSPTGHGPVLN